MCPDILNLKMKVLNKIMKKIMFLFAVTMMHQNYARIFLRTSHEIFYKTLIESSHHPDAKVVYLCMVGSPRLQDACLSALHAVSDKIFGVRLITDSLFESWKYPYFLQAEVNKKYKYMQIALILGQGYKPLIMFETNNRWVYSGLNISDNYKDLERQKKEFDQYWDDLRNGR